MDRKKALLIIGMQNDFMPWGSFPVFGADQLIPKILAFSSRFSHVYATQEWHPKDHISFAMNHGKKPTEEIMTSYGKQTLWPIHCVQDTLGAQLVAPLEQLEIKKVFQKGCKSDVESYSVFFDAKQNPATSIKKELNQENITDLYFVGVPTNMCVQSCLFDAKALGYEAFLVADLCASNERNDSLYRRWLRDLQEKRVKIIFSY